jgi:hypothetical protein
MPESSGLRIGDGLVYSEAWGQPCIYRRPGRQHPGAFDLISTDPEGTESSADDLTKDSE